MSLKLSKSKIVNGVHRAYAITHDARGYVAIGFVRDMSMPSNTNKLVYESPHFASRADALKDGKEWQDNN